MKLLTTTSHRHSDRVTPAAHQKLAALLGAFVTAPTDRDAARVNRELDAIRSHAS